MCDIVDLQGYKYIKNLKLIATESYVSWGHWKAFSHWQFDAVSFRNVFVGDITNIEEINTKRQKITALVHIL